MNLEALEVPAGAILAKDMDDDRSKATADKLGLRAAIEAMLESTDGPCGGAGMQIDGEWLVAVLAWARCDSGNGWATLAMKPASYENTVFLHRLTKRLLHGPPD